MRKARLALAGMTAAFLAGALTAAADINVYSWERYQAWENPGLDYSGNNESFNSSFANGGEPTGNTLPIVSNICVGGPLGPNGIMSAYSVRCDQVQDNGGSLFIYPSPASDQNNTNGNWHFNTNANWVVETWLLPTGSGTGNSGKTNGIALVTSANRLGAGISSGVLIEAINTNEVLNLQGDGTVYLRVVANAPANKLDTNGLPYNFQIGPDVLIKTPTHAAWVHVAVVRDDLNQTVSWYTNGVLVASTNADRVFYTNVFGCPCLTGMNNIEGSFQAGAMPFDGYLAETRWWSFSPGTFSVTNLLTRPPGPSLVAGPQNTTVFAGGQAVFTALAATDTSDTYQWFFSNGTQISGATNSALLLPSPTSGAQVYVVVTDDSGLSVTSAPATVTVSAATVNTEYSSSVMSEPSLQAYFPADGSTGAVLANLKDTGNPGTNVFNAYLNGDTNVAVGQQAVIYNYPNIGYSGGSGNPYYNLGSNVANGYTVISGANPNYYDNGNGFLTIEAVLNMAPSCGNLPLSTSEFPTWFCSGSYMQFMADFNGELYYQNNNQSATLAWGVPGGLIGKLTHVAMVFDHVTNVTCYANGVNLGTQQQANFGSTPPSATQPYYIGTRNTSPDVTGYIANLWRGSVGKVAIYNTNLSANDIQLHYYRLVNGSAGNPASVASISPSKSLYVGFPVQNLTVQAGGLPPFTYQWYSNSVQMVGDTDSLLAVTYLPTGVYNYSVAIQGAVGSAVTSAPITLTVIPPTGYAAKVYASSGGGPLAFWPLNETNGTTIFDWSGTHDGLASGSYALGGQGPVPGTGALQMFGSNSPGGISRVLVPYYPELNPISGTESVEFWYREDNTNSTMCAFSSQFAMGGNKAGLAIWNGPGTFGLDQTVIQNFTMILGRYNNVNQGVGQNVGPEETATVPENENWYHVAVVTDGPTGVEQLFVNGNAEYVVNTSYSLNPTASFIWNQNLGAPLTLGNWFAQGGQFPMDGALSQVAVYDYALTQDDISNHTSEVDVPAGFLTQPKGATNVEGFANSVTLSGNAFGAPNNYVWLKNGLPLPAGTNNLDGTLKYPIIASPAGDIQGVDSRVLVISEVNPGDSGQYQLQVQNPLNLPNGFTNSIVANVLITPDPTLPYATGVAALGTVVSGPVQMTVQNYSPNAPSFTTLPLLSLVEVKFNKRMDYASATNPANYSLSGGPTIKAIYLDQNSAVDATFGSDARTVTLQTTGLTAGRSYNLAVSGVNDQNFTPNTIPAATFTFTAPTLVTNAALWDYYYVTNGNVTLRSSGSYGWYPYVPQVSLRFTNFTEGYIAPGGNLGAVAPWNSGNAGSQFFQSLTAWLTPTNTGWYSFYIEASDNSQYESICDLFISTDSNPANAQFIGSAVSGNNAAVGGFNDTPYWSDIQMTAGQPYFIQLQGVSSSANNNMRVGWLYEGPNDGGVTDGGWNYVPSVNLPPIQGQFLSAYVQAPNYGAPVFNAGKLTLTWNGFGTIYQSTNLIQWTSLGYQASPYVITPSAATKQMYFKLEQ